MWMWMPSGDDGRLLSRVAEVIGVLVPACRADVGRADRVACVWFGDAEEALTRSDQVALSLLTEAHPNVGARNSGRPTS